MAKAKKEAKTKVETIEVPAEAVVVPNHIAKLSVDYGREDLNNIAIKVNEIIDALQK